MFYRLKEVTCDENEMNEKEDEKDPAYSRTGDWFYDKQLNARLSKKMAGILTKLEANKSKFTTMQQMYTFCGEKFVRVNNLVSFPEKLLRAFLPHVCLKSQKWAMCLYLLSNVTAADHMKMTKDCEECSRQQSNCD